MLPRMPVIPACVGAFETGDPQCNGDPSDPMPCTWRDKCGAFKTYLGSANGQQWLDPDSTLRKDADAFNSFCLERVRRFKIVNGLPEAPPEELLMPTLAQIAKDTDLTLPCGHCGHETALSGLLPQLFEIVLKKLSAGEPVVIRGFGTLKRERFQGRGLAKEAGDRWIIRFKAAPKAKQKLNQRSS